MPGSWLLLDMDLDPLLPYMACPAGRSGRRALVKSRSAFTGHPARAGTCTGTHLFLQRGLECMTLSFGPASSPGWYLHTVRSPRHRTGSCLICLRCGPILQAHCAGYPSYHTPSSFIAAGTRMPVTSAPLPRWAAGMRNPPWRQRGAAASPAAARESFRPASAASCGASRCLTGTCLVCRLPRLRRWILSRGCSCRWGGRTLRERAKKEGSCSCHLRLPRGGP